MTNTPSDEQPTYKTYKARWFQLLMFSLLSFSNAMIWISLAPVATLVQKFYGTSTYLVNLLSTIYMIVFIPGNPICSVILEKYGLRVTLLCGAILNMAGSWIRVAGSNSRSLFFLLMIGQCLCAIAQCFTLNIPPVLAAYWFPTNERSTATSIGAVFNQLGVAAGFISAVLVVNDVNYRSNLALLACICAGVCTVSGLCLLLFFREKPELPPSPSQLKEVPSSSDPNDIKSGSILTVLEGAKILLLDPYFMILSIGFGISQGCYYAITTLLDQLLVPNGFDSSASGIIGFILTTAGIVGALIAGFVADKTGKHTWLLRFGYIFTAASTVGFVLLLRPNTKLLIALYVIGGVLGFFISSLLPLSFELGVECTFNEKSQIDLEGLSGGLLMVSAQVFGVIFIFLMDSLIRRGYLVTAQWIVTGILVASSLAVAVGFHGKLKRMEFEKQRRAQSVETVDREDKS